MAKYTGAVRFDDGALLYFVYSGTVDIARPRLYESADAAFAAWADDEPVAVSQSSPDVDDEPVAVMPYFMHGSDEVHFHSRASRTRMVITRPRSLEAATIQKDEPIWGWGK